MTSKRKTLLLSKILLLLVLILAGSFITQNCEKNFRVQGQTSNVNTITKGNINAKITIQSPGNKAYNKNNINLAFTVKSPNPPMELSRAGLLEVFLRHGVALDYSTPKLVDLIENTNLLGDFPNSPLVALSDLGNNTYGGNATLTDLSQGPHSITIWIDAEQNYLSYGVPVGFVFTTVSFNIDSIPPKISILSSETKTYNTSDVPMDFAVNKTVSQISYSLDGQENITAVGNLTLTQLPNGSHNVTIYATDEAGNVGSSQTFSFIIAKPEARSFPTAIVAAVSGVSAVVVVAGLLVYFKKRKH